MARLRGPHVARCLRRPGSCCGLLLFLVQSAWATKGFDSLQIGPIIDASDVVINIDLNDDTEQHYAELLEGLKVYASILPDAYLPAPPVALLREQVLELASDLGAVDPLMQKYVSLGLNRLVLQLGDLDILIQDGMDDVVRDWSEHDIKREYLVTQRAFKRQLDHVHALDEVRLREEVLAVAVRATEARRPMWLQSAVLWTRVLECFRRFLCLLAALKQVSFLRMLLGSCEITELRSFIFGLASRALDFLENPEDMLDYVRENMYAFRKICEGPTTMFSTSLY